MTSLSGDLTPNASAPPQTPPVGTCATRTPIAYPVKDAQGHTYPIDPSRIAAQTHHLPPPRSSLGDFAIYERIVHNEEPVPGGKKDHIDSGMLPTRERDGLGKTTRA
jgi:hypothetical protein